MSSRPLLAPSLLACAALSITAHAALVRVTITGEVESNAFANNGSNTFGGLGPGTPVRLVLELESTNFLDSPNLPGVTRGYTILPNSMVLYVGDRSAWRLETTPATPAYFVLRNNDPRADGFFISQGTDIDTQIPLNMVPTNFGIEFSRTFNIDPPFPTPDDSLTSLDILDATGSWGFEDISSFNFGVGGIGGQFPLIFLYERITIESLAPSCPADLDDDGDFDNGGHPDGGVAIGDLLYLLQAFERGHSAADLDNGSGQGIPDGGVTIDDLLFYLIRFEAGC